MRGFFGWSLSEIAMLAILLMASMPIIRSTENGNFWPIITGVTYYLISGQFIKGQSHALRILLSLLLAMISVSTPYRGKRFYENFEDGADSPIDEQSNPVESALSSVPMGNTGNDVNLPGTDVKTNEDGEVEEEFAGNLDVASRVKKTDPNPVDLKDLGEKYLNMEATAKNAKKYRIPSEKEDGEHHLDSGTTFMNAYKQLKPDQINALTADTQKLISVQKDLMSNLSNLKPLISDGKEIMNTFKSFFGSDSSSN